MSGGFMQDEKPKPSASVFYWAAYQPPQTRNTALRQIAPKGAFASYLSFKR
jgi:hypothetical protein